MSPPAARGAAAEARRRRASALVVLLALASLIGLDLALVLRPEQIEARIRAALERTFECEVALDGVEVRGDGVRLASVTWWAPAAAGAGASARSSASAPAAPAAGAASLARDVRLRLSRPGLLAGRVVIEHVDVGEVETSVDRVQALLEAMRRGRGGAGRAALADTARIQVRRLVLDRRGALFPLLRGGSEAAAPAGGPAAPRGPGEAPARARDPRIVLERVRVQAERGGSGEGGGRWRAVMAYRAGQLTRLALRARLDLERGVVTLWLRASNVEAGERLGEALPPAARAFLDEHLRPEGPVDLDLEAELPWAAPEAARLRGEVACYTLALRPPALDRPITNIRGRMRLDGEALRIEGLRGRIEGADVHLRGSVADLRALRGLDLELSAREAPLEALTRVLGGGAALERLGLAGLGSLVLRLRSGEREAAALASLDGDLELDGASALGGAVSGIEGAVAIERGAWLEAGRDRLPRFRLRLAALEAGGLPLRQLAGVCTADAAGLHFEALSASLGGGELSGRARLGPAPGQLALRLDGRDLPLAPLAEALLGEGGRGLAGRGEELHLELERSAPGGLGAGRLDLRVQAFDPFAHAAARPLDAELARAGLAPEPFRQGRIAVVLGPEGDRLDADLVGQAYAARAAITRNARGELQGEVTFRSPRTEEVLLGLEVTGTASAPRFR